MGHQSENTIPMESTALSSSTESSASSSSMESPASLSSSSPWRLGSPLTYLFGGIGVMLLLIALALLMLTCSHLRHRYEDTSDRKAVKHVCKGGDEANASPKIVVIMAGEEIPTYLAAPAHVTSSRTCESMVATRKICFPKGVDSQGILDSGCLFGTNHCPPHIHPQGIASGNSPSTMGHVGGRT